LFVFLELFTARGRVEDQCEFLSREYAINHLISTSPKPVISLLDGFVFGGGAGISIHGQFRIATENTVFAMPETAIGFWPDVGASFFLPRLDYGLGYYLGLTGVRLKGQDV
jgi:enoyl-CoA hydratase/carnithine racemase